MKNNFRLSLPYSHVQRLAEERGISLPEALSLLPPWGIGRVDVDTDVFDPSAVRAAGLSVGAFYAFYDAGTGDVTAVEEAIAAGADTLVLLPLSKTGATAFFSGAAAIAEHGRKRGISVLLENLAAAGSLLATPSDAESVLRAGAATGLSFHTAQYFLRDVNTVLAFRDMKDGVRRVVLCDLLPDEQTFGDTAIAREGDLYYYPAPVGKGVFPMKTLRHTLRDTGFTGDVSLSLYGVKSMEDALLRSVGFLNE